MAISNSDAAGAADGTIEALLERRAQYEQWLARLDATADKAPSAVRDRVRSDYEARLRGVMDELRGHSATIRQELEQHRTTQSRLSADRRAAEETLAEAEVRYTVGEYGDDEWERLSGESQRHLEQLRGELDAVGSEIARLAEVQAIIGGGSARPVEASPAPAPTPAVAPVASTPQPLPSPSPTPMAFEQDPFESLRLESMPAESRPLEAAPAPAIDELAFLKSVSDEDQRPAAPPPRRPPATAAKPVEPAPVAPIASAPVPTPVAVPAPTPIPVPTPVPNASSAGTAPGKTAGMAKTLKCNECGTLNRPTEWYCERCGAELAAL